jgi:DNA repair protein RecO (recombination protein O)
MSSVAKSRIVVLHLTKYGESSLILHAIDALSGRRSFLVRGIKRGNATAVFHPLAILDVVSAESPKSSLAWLREWEPAAELHDIRGNLLKASVAMFLSEVLYRSFTSELADPQFFDWLCETVGRLDREEGSIANYPMWFLVSYAVQLGFRPDQPVEPQGIFTPTESDLLFTLLRSPFPEAMALSLSAQRRSEFSRKMLQYLSYHLGATIDAKSLDVLHEVLA